MKQSEEKTLDMLRSLATQGWLSEQPMDFRIRMARAGRWTIVPRGALVYGFGDTPNAIYGLVEGLLDISIPIGGDEEVTIHRAGPGFWIGESALLAEMNRGITLLAASDCRVFRIPISMVRRSLAEHPEDWPCFFRLSHKNVSLALQVLAETLSLSPRARFARTLIRMASADGLVRVTQEELGRMAGMSRAAFRRSFIELIESGAVHTKYGQLRIVDHAALDRAAQEE